MLYFIAVWTLLLIISGIIGLGLLNGLRADRFNQMGDRLIIAEWLGVVTLTIALFTTSLFLPLSPLVGAIVAFILCLCVLAFRANRTELANILRLGNSRKLLAVSHAEVGFLASTQPTQGDPRKLLAGLLAVMIAVAAWMTQEVTWIDTGLYHYGNIQWFAQYGSVSGIALIFANYGFTSSWFALAAPFNPEWLDARATAMTNGFALLLVVCQFLLHSNRILQQEGTISDWFMVIFLLMIPPIARLDGVNTIIISPSPDMPVLLLVSVIAWCFLTICNSKAINVEYSKTSVLNIQLIPLFLAIGAVTMKLTAIPLLFVASLFYSYRKGFKLDRFVVASAIAILLLIPVFAYNVKASGCPLYPSSVLCFDLPWSLPLTVAQETAEATHGWNSWFGEPPAGMPRWLWASWRWLNTTTTRFMAFMLVVNVFCLVYLFRRRVTESDAGKYWVIAISITGIAFFLKTAPFFRFSLSYLILLPALSVALACHDWVSAKLRWNRYPDLIQRFKVRWAIAVALPTLLVAVTLHGNSLSRLVLPPPLRRVPVVQRQATNFLYWSPEQPDELCWSTPIPCTTLVNPDVFLKDPERGISVGFVRQ